MTCYCKHTSRIVGVSRILNIKSKWILVVRVLTFLKSSHFVLDLFVEFIINLQESRSMVGKKGFWHGF